MDDGFIARSILLQLVVFSMVPFLYWLVRERKGTSFFSYIGLTCRKMTAPFSTILLFFAAYFVVYGVVHFTPIAALTQTSVRTYEGAGVVMILPGFFISFVQQALSEEILFRGFIGKRLIAKTGILAGNLLQAVIFGAAHVLLSISSEKDLLTYCIIMVSMTAGGWLLGYLDEKMWNGSILPSILLHGVGNFITLLSVAL